MTLGPVYLLQGEEFLVDEGLERVRQETGGDSLSEVRFGPEVEVAELVTALGTPSLLGGLRLVIVNDAQDLNKEQATALETYVASPSPSAVLVLVASGKTKLDATVKRLGTVISLDAPKGRRLVGWLRQQATGLGITIDDKAAWALIDSVGNELRDLDGSLHQLANAFPEGRVGAAQVRQTFPRLADQRVWVFTDAVGDRRLPLAVSSLRRLLEQGDEPLVIFGALSNHVRRMLRARRHAERGPQAVGDALGMPPWRAERLTDQSRSYREEELVGAMQILARTDVEMKGGGDMPPEIALERAVHQIVTGEI